MVCSQWSNACWIFLKFLRIYYGKVTELYRSSSAIE